MSKPPALRELQQLLQGEITQTYKTSGNLMEWLIGGAEGLHVYLFAYYERLHDILKSDFPMVALILGEDSFRGMVAEYLERFPSRYKNAAEVGAHLPGMLIEHPLRAPFPYIHEMALLEWTLIRSFYADNGQVSLDANAITDWENTIFEFNPSLFLLEVEYPIHQIWNDEVSHSLSPQKTYLKIHRNSKGNALPWEINAAEYKLLKGLQNKLPLIQVIESLHEMEGEIDLAPLFQKWVEEKTIGNIYDR